MPVLAFSCLICCSMRSLAESIWIALESELDDTSAMWMGALRYTLGGILLSADRLRPLSYLGRVAFGGPARGLKNRCWLVEATGAFRSGAPLEDENCLCTDASEEKGPVFGVLSTLGIDGKRSGRSEVALVSDMSIIFAERYSSCIEESECEEDEDGALLLEAHCLTRSFAKSSILPFGLRGDLSKPKNGEYC